MENGNQKVQELLQANIGCSVRAMMGDWVVYYNQKVVGGVYDGRLLVKPTPAARKLLPFCREELPYLGAKPMLLVTQTEPTFLSTLFSAIANELPAPHKKK